MKIIEVNNYQELLSLKNEWANLLEKCDHTVFSTWEWLSTWWKHFGNNKRLVLLLAMENDKIVGIAPLMYSTRKICGLPTGKITFIGTPHTDYTDFITEKAEKCICLFIDYLKRHLKNWNYIELTEIPENSKSIPILTSLSKFMKLSTPCPYKPLTKSRETLWDTLSKAMRNNLKRYVKKTERDFTIEFVDYSDVQSCSEGMRLLFNLHQKRWSLKGCPGAFANAKFRNFNLEIARIFARKNYLGLFILKLSGQPVAAIYGFKYQKKFYQYLSGFDPDYSRYSIGNQLILYTMEKCIEEGLFEFDFMRGGEAHKYFWTAFSRWNRTTIIPRNSLWTTLYWIYTKIGKQSN
ncbi:MAG: GNAT family N-acetyltransferase [Conexivisphaerales archaeon]